MEGCVSLLAEVVHYKSGIPPHPLASLAAVLGEAGVMKLSPSAWLAELS